MIEFIRSARRTLRLQLRLEAQLAVASAGHLGYTEDVGPGGCRLVAPLRLATGTRLRLVLAGRGDPPLLAVAATVVWRQNLPAWRHGLEFASESLAGAMGWFDELARGRLDLLDLDRGPDQIRLGDRICVAQLPREPLSREEAVVLRLASDRPSVAELRVVLGQTWSRAQRALYSLLNRGVVALVPGGSRG